jgi:hypothetical protein
MAAGGCSDAWHPAVQELPSPAADRGTSGPQLSTLDGRAILSWLEREDDRATLKFADRTASGWSEPRTVASGSDWFVNWADVPSVVRLPEGVLAAHWLQKNATDTYAYDVRLSFSKDEGRTWSAPTTPHHDGTANEHGFATLFAAPGGGLGLVWLDGRAMQGEGNGAMTLRSALFAADGTQRSESLVDERVCDCCPTAAVTTADGIVTAYRDRGDQEVRDIFVSRFADGAWTKPAAVHDDGWRIDACPVNGPALAAHERQVAIAWFNAKVDQGHVFAAFSSDGGKTFGSPIGVDDASALGRVDVELLADGSAAVAWIEYAEERAQLRVRRVTPNGGRSESTVVSNIASGRASGYPRLARVGEELLFAWTESQEGRSRVRTAAARLAP